MRSSAAFTTNWLGSNGRLEAVASLGGGVVGPEPTSEPDPVRSDVVVWLREAGGHPARIAPRRLGHTRHLGSTLFERSHAIRIQHPFVAVVVLVTVLCLYPFVTPSMEPVYVPI